MRGGTFRTFMAGVVCALVLCTNLPAGPIAEAVGKGWDKAIGKIVKVHDAAKSLKPKGKLIKGAAKKVKAKRKGADCCCNSN